MNSILEFEQKYDVRLIPKSKSPPMRIIGFFSKSFMINFWTTYRLPFKKPVITYPNDINNPMLYPHILEHEIIHVEDMRSPWGLFKSFCLVWLLPLPIFFSGRWFIERKAYLHNIKNHNYEIEWVVDTLWNSYGWCWPKFLMRRWFNKKLRG